MDYIRDSIKKVNIKRTIPLAPALIFLIFILYVWFSSDYQIGFGTEILLIILIIFLIPFIFFIIKNIFEIYNLNHHKISKCLQVYSNDIDYIVREINRSIEKNLLFKYNTDKSYKTYIFVTDEWFAFFSENNSIIKKIDELVEIHIENKYDFENRHIYSFSFCFNDKTTFREDIYYLYGQELLELFKQYLPNTCYESVYDNIMGILKEFQIKFQTSKKNHDT